MKIYVMLRPAIKIFLILFFATGMFFIITAINIYSTALKDEKRQTDAIVILGSAEYAGRPSPVFQSRLDHGANLYENGFAKLIIVAGGQDKDEVYSEAGVGKAYLIKQKNIREANIVAEEYSLTTIQNISRLKDHFEALGLHEVILVSDPFHMFRAKWLAKHWGMEVYTSPTRSSPISKNRWIEFKFVIREIIAFSGHLFLRL